MSKYALFLGCTTPIKVPQYELSARWVSKRLGIELVDIEDFVCCGFNQGNLSIEGGLLLAAMNLAFAEAQDLDIVTLCAACNGFLAETVAELKDEATRDRINKKLSLIDLEYNGRTKVKHISRVIYEDVGLDRIEKAVKRDLSKLRVAPHYGCHYLKPKSAFEGFDEPDNPKTLHHLISATGAAPIQYETLLHCCGGKTFPVSPDIAHLLIEKKLNDLQTMGIDAMIVQCQTCYLMYDSQQQKVAEKFNTQYNIPVLLYPQLLGLAMGGDPATDLGFDLNTMPLDKVLAKVKE